MIEIWIYNVLMLTVDSVYTDHFGIKAMSGWLGAN